MKKIKYASYLILAFSIVLFGFSVFMFQYLSMDLDFFELEASVNVSEGVIGFNIDENTLSFGKAPPGAVLQRNVVFSNERDFPVVVVASARGKISEFLSFEKKHVVGAGESTKMGFILSVPADMGEGFYEGTVELRTRPYFSLTSKIFKKDQP